MALPELLQTFRTPACFTLDEAIEALEKPRSTVLDEVKYLMKQDYIRSVRRGLYVFDPDRTGQKADRFVVASKATDPYLLGYHSALELHGVARSAFFDTVYVASPRRFSNFTYDGSQVRRVKTSEEILEAGETQVKRDGENLQVANRELTLIQCLHRPKYAGGLEEVLDSLEGFPYVRWPQLTSLLDLFDQKNLYRRVGWVATYHRSRWDPPTEVLDELQEQGGDSPDYFGTTPERGGTLVPEWNLLVPDRFAEGTPHG